MPEIVGIEQFTNTLMDELKKYGKLIDDEIADEAKKAAKELSMKLKSESPKRAVNGGSYAADWSFKKKDKTTYIDFNKKHYQLTHLLEHGHATRNGGRTKEQPHIAPASDLVINNFLEALQRIVEAK